MRVNNRLKVLRAERNWSQQDLAECLGVSRQSVNAIETGKYYLSPPLAFRIAELFGLAIEQVFVSPTQHLVAGLLADLPKLRRGFSLGNLLGERVGGIIVMT